MGRRIKGEREQGTKSEAIFVDRYVFPGNFCNGYEQRECAKETLEDPKNTLTVAFVDHDFYL